MKNTLYEYQIETKEIVKVMIKNFLIFFSLFYRFHISLDSLVEICFLVMLNTNQILHQVF